LKVPASTTFVLFFRNTRFLSIY